MKWLIPFVLIFNIILLGCSTQDAGKIPDTQPDMMGKITKIKRTAAKNKSHVATILVEPPAGLNSHHSKANIKVDQNTLIQNLEGEPLKLEHLREGLKVEAWFDGPTIETDPIQVHAKAIRVSDQ